MKKFVFGIICMFVLFFAMSCKTSEVVQAEQPKPEPQKNEGKKPVPFEQNLLRGISQKDSALVYKKAAFFNSCEIKLEQSLSDISFFVDDKGNVLKVDTITEAQKLILPMTPGGLISIRVSKTYKEIITMIVVSFSKKDINYELSFWRNNEGLFVLSGNAILTINNHQYRVIAKTNSICYLLFNFDYKAIPKPIKEQAEGYSSGGVTNTTIQNNNDTKKEDSEGFQPTYLVPPLKKQ